MIDLGVLLINRLAQYFDTDNPRPLPLIKIGLGLGIGWFAAAAIVDIFRWLWVELVTTLKLI